MFMEAIYLLSLTDSYSGSAVIWNLGVGLPCLMENLW